MKENSKKDRKIKKNFFSFFLEIAKLEIEKQHIRNRIGAGDRLRYNSEGQGETEKGRLHEGKRER